MNDTLNDVRTEPVSGLAHRVRAAQPGSTKAPCLILLHGVGANETGFIELARHMDPRLVVILARAPLVLGPSAFAWFQVRFTPSGPAIDAGQAERSRIQLLDFIRHLPAMVDVDPERIWIAGFSQGGIMSASVALTAPHSVAGFGVLSGRVLPEVLPKVESGPALERVHAFVGHGVADEKLGIHFARAARDVLSSLNVRLAYHEYACGHTLDRAMVNDFQRWLAQQLDHAHAASGIQANDKE